MRRSDRRMEYAKQRLEMEGINYQVHQNGYLLIVHSKFCRDRFTFNPNTGAIIGPYDERGIEQMVSIASRVPSFKREEA